MSLGTRLKKEREKKGWSQLFVADKIGITNTVLSNYERDYRDPDTQTLKRLAELFEVSVDYLLGVEGTSQKSDLPPLTPKDERDIARDLERMLSDLESKDSIAFYGEAMDEESKELLRISLENSMRLAKQMAKQKFTPNKYRK